VALARSSHAPDAELRAALRSTRLRTLQVLDLAGSRGCLLGSDRDLAERRPLRDPEREDPVCPTGRLREEF